MKNKKIYSKHKIIAHRGGKYKEGENFNYIPESIKHGADIIELDIRIKNGEYIVKHGLFSRNQGKLIEALKKIKDKALYLDIKDKKVDPNQLIQFVRKIKPKINIIVGSFNKKILLKVKKDKNIILNYHCIPFFIDYAFARSGKMDWINPIPYGITKKEIDKIKKEFKFVPAGIENYKKQEKFMNLGAYAISVHNIKSWKDYFKSIKKEKGWRLYIEDKIFLKGKRFCPPHHFPHKLPFTKPITTERCHIHAKKWRMAHHIPFCFLFCKKNYKAMMKFNKK